MVLIQGSLNFKESSHLETFIHYTVQTNGYDLNSVICETSRTFRNKKRDHVKEIIKLDTDNKNKNIRELYGGINK